MLFNFCLTGVTPLLLHPDDIEASDRIKEWQDDPKKKNLSKKGDDRTPAWVWKTRCPTDGEDVVVPTDYLMACLRTAGAKIKMPGGHSNKTFKSESQSGLLITSLYLPIDIDGKTIKAADIEAIQGEANFPEHKAAVEKLGFKLFVKRAKIGQAKHIRVRPRFDTWKLSGQIKILLPEITEDILRQMFELAGRYVGIGDWRPSSPRSPGQFGCFTATLALVAE